MTSPTPSDSTLSASLPPSADTNARHSESILLIEDCAETRRDLMTALKFLGERALAVTSEDSAREFQRRLQDLQSDTELIPLVGGNRDGLSQREFERQYQSRMSDEYRERIEDIDKEVAQLALFAEYPEP